MPRNVYIETFGCQMNELDSELVSGQLRALGYRFVPEADAADVVLYNTCSVREHAEQKVWSRLGELAVRKREEPALVVGVLGCLAERDGEALVKRMPVVDILCGPGELDKLPGLLDNAVRTRESLMSDVGCRTSDVGEEKTGREPLVSARQVALQGSASRRSATLAAAGDSLELLDLSRSISAVDEHDAAKRSAYVRITRGCNKFCTYCVVPFTRGAEVHRPPQHIIDECKRLADAGVIEVTLLGQTVNHYRFEHGAAVTVNGLTQPQKGRTYAGGHSRDPFAGANTTTFADLLARIHDEVPAIRRLRFVTSYPRDFGNDVLEVMRDHPRICRYLHVPGQSGSDRILKLMNRGYTVSEYVEFLDRARSYLHQPEINRPLMISGDFIIGFPTETDEDFEGTVALVKRARYKNSFIFKYSARPGTVAIDKYPDDVPESVKRERNGRLLALQGAISEEISREQVGETLEVFVEGLSPRERKKRARAQAPHHSHGTVSLTIRGLSADEGDDSCCSVSPAEEVVEAGAPQLRGRTDGDLIVLFDVPQGRAAESLVGEMVRVKITGASGLSCFGDVVG
ncbi:MAG TPA: MiaB/RimO family radical SAM methylthiotransferase [Phycisphaerales bacterium]|nr:MiaB/RimO family radical SAM methylthiotransferase [Phycisphaerales bacterium]